MSVSEEEARIEEGLLRSVDEVFKEMTGIHLRKQLDDYIPKIRNVKSDAIVQYNTGNMRFALVLACVAIEIFVRQIVIKPLAQGAFYYEEWADLLATKIGTGNAGNDRDVFYKVMKTIKFDVNSLMVDGKAFIECWKNIAELRNKIMHDYIEVSDVDTDLAVKCIKILFDRVLPYLLEYYHIREESENAYELYYKSNFA